MTTKKASKPNQQIIIVRGGQADAVIRQINATSSKKEITLDEAIQQWISWKTRQSNGARVIEWSRYVMAWARDMKIGRKALSSVNERDIEAWVNTEGLKLNTRKGRLAIIRSLFEFLSIRELFTGRNPTLLVEIDYGTLSHKEKESKEILAFSDDQFKNLVAHLDRELKAVEGHFSVSSVKLKRDRLYENYHQYKFWRTAAIISRCSGLRMGDVCQLEFDALEKKLTVWTDKRNKRVQPYIWNPQLFADTIKSIPRDHHQYCFAAERLIYLSRQRPKLNMQFKRLCDKLGMEGLTFHSLRHAYVTECQKAGMPMADIAKSVGHSSVRTTQGYVH